MDDLYTVELDPVGPHLATVVWLHGLGQDADTLVPVARRLGLPGAGVRGVFPRAPALAAGQVTGGPARAWYDQRVFTLDRLDLDGLFAAEQRLTALLRAETDRIGPGRTVLAGFSQGATTALAVALRHPGRLAGLALYAGFLPEVLEPVLAATRSPAAARLPVWLGHGVEDWVVPVTTGERLRDTLTGWGHPVSWQRYRAGHRPFAGVTASLPRFLGRTLGIERLQSVPVRRRPGPPPGGR
ncbi:alpha/beta hydrolase [Kitasatospora sp. NPDC088346]|uniref:alpha/beta hydrolase n=1 Tax=Kitasatospora sp. NPDC088346 TaxID=3364073 RepID=UPI003815C90A